MRKRLLLVLFAVFGCLCFLAPTVYAEDAGDKTFSEQLNPSAKAIYDKLSEALSEGKLYDGTYRLDVTDAVVAATKGMEDRNNGAYGEAAGRELGHEGEMNIVDAYKLKGNRDLFNDFAAAKDAFDLEHPDAWYIDSSFLTLSVGHVGEDDNTWHAIVGPGRTATYYLNGQSEYGPKDGERKSFSEETVKAMDKELMDELSSMVDEVKNMSRESGETDESLRARQITKAHELVVDNISYRFEDECDPMNSLFVRTLYGMHTHEGVCEAYARSLQYILTHAGITDVRLVNGMQTSGEPEQHMWVVVKLGDSWYGIDPTWDDPVKFDEDGKLDPSGSENGLDGRESTSYLLVGSDTLANWVANGVFSQNGFEFAYPVISETDYVGGEMFNRGGLSVKYSSAGEMEGSASGTFTVQFEGEGIKKAGEKGYYLLVKEYDTYANGQTYGHKDWYYVGAGLAIMDKTVSGGHNPFFYDDGEKLVMQSATVDYVEYAMTTRKPEGYDLWWTDDPKNPLLSGDADKIEEVSYYKGDGSDILCETGQLRSVNGDYEAQPYVKTQTPAANAQTATGKHMARVLFDDNLLFKDTSELTRKALQWDDSSANLGDLKKLKPPTKIEGSELSSDQVVKSNEYFDDLIRVPESVVHWTEGQNLGAWGGEGKDMLRVAYKCEQRDIDGELLPYKLQGKVAFDDDAENMADSVAISERNYNSETGADGFVDSDTANFNWLFECTITDENHTHTPYGTGIGSNGYVIPGESCKLVGVEFEFDGSSMWADDMTYYEFSIVGGTGDDGAHDLVGARSQKAPNSWGYLVCDPECPYAYRSQGIDWNLWGKPSLLDNPDDLNMDNFVINGVGDEDGQSLADLQKSMNLDYLNGRLTLVVEDLSANRDRVEEMEGVLATQEDLADASKAIKSKSLYEIGFSNICRQTVNDVQTGDSMRVQVGFPEGYNSTSPVVFKAYHFERDDSGKITSVQEIPVVVTEYGLIVLCDSFSPFEMVALDPEQVSNADSDDSVYTDSVVVAGDGHVTITADGENATAGAGAVVQAIGESFEDGAVEFEFKPDDGYEITNVTFAGGVKEDAISSGKLTVKKSDLEEIASENENRSAMGINTILSVETAPVSLKEVPIEGVEGQTFSASPVGTCSHQSVSTGDYQAATCTVDGHTSEIVCNDCGTVITPERTVQKSGHVAKVGENKIEKTATCTEAGKTADIVCQSCGETIESGVEIAALGHTYGADGHCVRERECGAPYSWSYDQKLDDISMMAQSMLALDKSLNADDYTLESWTNYHDVLDRLAECYAYGEDGTITGYAEEPSNDSFRAILSGHVDDVVRLRAALDERADNSELKDLVDSMQDLNSEDYTPDTWAAFEEALDAATALLDDRDATSQALSDAVHELQLAFDALEDAVKEELPVRADLREAFSTFSHLREVNYTPESYATLRAAYDAAQAVYDRPDATEDELEAALSVLNQAIDALELAPVDEPTLSALNSLIADVEALNSKAYTNASWSYLKRLVESAKASIEDGLLSVTQVKSLYNQIASAMNHLVLDETYVEPDPENEASKTSMAALQALIAKCVAYDLDDYNALAIYNFKAAIVGVKMMVAKGGMTEEDVQGAIATLNDAIAALEASDIAPTEPEDSLVTVYRLYNRYSGEHLFTTDVAERVNLINLGWNDEGIAWKSPVDGTVGVQRLYNPNTGEHHYTTSLNEVLVLQNAGWNYEGEAFKDAGPANLPVYRLYNMWIKGPGAHLFTLDSHEYETLPDYGWDQEGVAWHAFAANAK